MEILTENYQKYDTKLIALNGEEYIVKKDEPYYITIKENLLCWCEPTDDNTIIPPVVKSINLNNIIEIKRVE